MSILNSLKLVAATTAPKAQGIQRQRNKLATKLDEQIDMARAKRDGQTYAPKMLKYVLNVATGQKVRVEAYKRVRPWFWLGADSSYCFNVRYGSKVVELGKGKNAVSVEGIAQLVDALEKVKEAVLAGELDAEIDKASGALRSGFKKRA